MNKKTVLQGVLLFLILLILLIFYLKYFNNKPKTINIISLEKKNNISKNNSSTYIDNIDYVSSDGRGNKYKITAEQAEIKTENYGEMFLTNVIAYIFVKDSDPVKITSNFGKYNSKDYDTVFSKNVIIFYPGHKITGEYLDFSFINNLGTISKNVTYNGNKTNLFADKIEINLTNKDTKIFMDDSNKKVLIKGKK
tara:strand:- start:38 stop:622 length:585 start_codon:yes stop_codon:yes gene_type:complete